MTNKEAMQMALDALDRSDYLGWEANIPAMKALRAALAQPEPEPFEYWNAVEGWVKIDETRQHFDSVGCGTIYKSAGENRVPLYTAPSQRKEWVGLTDMEIVGVATINQSSDFGFARAIEAKLKDKNT